MPRLRWPQLWRLYYEDRHLPSIFQGCRSVDGARNELRWLREHASAASKVQASPGPVAGSSSSKARPVAARRHLLHLYCRMRRLGRPLQYIIGDQPFGDVEILCRPGVLIPRIETEAYTTHLANLLTSARHRKKYLDEDGAARAAEVASASPLRVLDLCTGTGCISLALNARLSAKFRDLQILGVDISPGANRLAKANLRRNVILGRLPEKALRQVRFSQKDIHSIDDSELEVFADASNGCTQEQNAPERVQRDNDSEKRRWDILISNPPYISPTCYLRTTCRTVRNWEPRLALVPQQKSCRGSFPLDAGDGFYPCLLDLARRVDTGIVLLETADLAQAGRVARLGRGMSHWDGIEIWRDWPDQDDDGNGDGKTSVEDSGYDEKEEDNDSSSTSIPIRGTGNGRSVFLWKRRRSLRGR